jgi:hypothetical protein
VTLQGSYERLLGELDARNVDNAARTNAYLELYALTRTGPVELPWLLMAHVVSRNAGYLMSDLSTAIERQNTVFSRAALEEMFLFLERSNYLIFWDAWHHVLLHLLGRSHELDDRTPAFIRGAWDRYERDAAGGVSAGLERRIVLELVQNEQELLERHVIHHPRFPQSRAMTTFFEAARAERPMVLPVSDAKITVGGFLLLDRRIAAGRRIFDEVIGPRGARDAIFAWVRERPHTGSREVAGGKPTPPIADAWPIKRVRGLWPEVHTPPAEP